MKKVAVVMGSAHDIDVVSGAISALKSLNVPHEVHVFSAHRTPAHAAEFAQRAADSGIGVIIAAAGMAAHLAGVIAAHTTLPVIGLPLSAKVIEGMDALFATVQMPPGIPVATVGVDASKNAGLLAAEMLAIAEPELAQKLIALRKEQEAAVLKDNDEIEKRYNA